MLVDLRKVLVDGEGIGDARICPYLSRYDVMPPAKMLSEPTFVSFTVLCVGDKCGRYCACVGFIPPPKP